MHRKDDHIVREDRFTKPCSHRPTEFGLSSPSVGSAMHASVVDVYKCVRTLLEACVWSVCLSERADATDRARAGSAEDEGVSTRREEDAKSASRRGDYDGGAGKKREGESDSLASFAGPRRVKDERTRLLGARAVLLLLGLELALEEREKREEKKATY